MDERLDTGYPFAGWFTWMLTGTIAFAHSTFGRATTRFRPSARKKNTPRPSNRIHSDPTHVDARMAGSARKETQAWRP